MTLCAAWIREKSDNKELVFATDSTLTGGEKWDTGIKLFELPRKDCLICFAGETHRAYPLILNLITSLKSNNHFINPHTDLNELEKYILDLFTGLVKEIKEPPNGMTLQQLRSEARFIFGGWSWKENRFKLWKLFYNESSDKFESIDHSEKNANGHTFILLPNPPNILEDAELIYKKVIKNNLEGVELDMQPLELIIKISREKPIREVDGPPQVAKVYQSGINEFFGIFWPSIEGKPYLYCRGYNDSEKPLVKYFDPDTSELIFEELPEEMPDLSEFDITAETKFIEECYPNNRLKENLSEFEKEKLLLVYRKHSYDKFLKECNEKPRTLEINVAN